MLRRLLLKLVHHHHHRHYVLRAARSNYSTLPLHRKGLQVHVEKISTDPSHPLNNLASAIASLQREAEDIFAVSKEFGDKELQTIAEEDVEKIRTEMEIMSAEFLQQLVSSCTDPLLETCEEILVELAAGVGGQEAMLFNQELYLLYLNYARWQNWDVETIQYDQTELGGLRHGTLQISSLGAYRCLYQEAGVHRVQRVPKTEKSGRIHTSTASVSILPTPSLVELDIPMSDLKIETKKASGAGGQHVNTTESAVRMTHIPSGLSVDCQTERSQIQNRASALRILQAKLYKVQMDQQEKNNRDKKKNQIGLSERSDKIRTFNYIQDRVTDHRVGVSYFNAKNMLAGGDAGAQEFHKFISDVKLKLFELHVKEVLQ